MTQEHDLLREISYLLAFAICGIVFATLRSRGLRQWFLLLASFALYMTWVPWFAAVLFVSAGMNFMVGIWLRRKNTALPLATGVVLNLVLLIVFKYLPEFVTRVPGGRLHAFASLALPLGISFWTFQALSYLFDLYRGDDLDPSFAEFLLYMSFFPVTISGPVCRMPEMLPQFRSERPTSRNEVLEGLRRIAIGVFMMQLSKLLGQGILASDGIVSGFDRATHWSGPDVWCLAIGYGFELFFDFAGYTHVAVGAAKALGISVPENFDRPFSSTTASIFWTRWHMSLSFWIRDYVFFPVATWRREVWWRNLALAGSMVLFGIWHKATLLFLLWGLYHGVLLVVHRQIQQVERKFQWEPPAAVWTPLAWISTMALVSLGWIFFRATSLSQAKEMLLAVVSPHTYASHFLSLNLYALVAALAAGYAISVWIAGILDRASESDAPQSGVMVWISRWRWFWLPAVYALAMFFVLMITLTQEGGAGQLMYRGF